MAELLGMPPQLFFGQLLLGLINGAFFAMLSLGLAIIFGMLQIVNFAHGATYMVGAFVAWMMMNYLGIGFWPALITAPIIVALLGVVIEKLILKHLYELDHLYGMLATFGLALIIEGLFRQAYGISGLPYEIPQALQGGTNLGFMYLPTYRGFVVLVSIILCFGIWYLIERTKMGIYLRAATENPELVKAFGINVPRLITFTFALGVGLAAFAGVMAAPIYQVNPLMGNNVVIVIFAIVVIGGMGSILGAILSGFLLGIVQGLTRAYYPEASDTVIFIVMIIILIIKPSGLFGKEQ